MKVSYYLLMSGDTTIEGADPNSHAIEFSQEEWCGLVKNVQLKTVKCVLHKDHPESNMSFSGGQVINDETEYLTSLQFGTYLYFVVAWVEN